MVDLPALAAFVDLEDVDEGEDGDEVEDVDAVSGVVDVVGRHHREVVVELGLGLVDVGPGPLEVDEHVGEPVLDDLERRQGAPELVADAEVGPGQVEQCADHPHVLRGQPDPLEDRELGPEGVLRELADRLVNRKS